MNKVQTIDNAPLDQQVKKWPVKKLEQELKDIRWHIDNVSVGRWELGYEDLLVKELEWRDRQNVRA